MLFCLKKHGIIYNFVFFSNIKLINLCAFLNCMKVKCSSAVDSFKGLVVAGVFSLVSSCVGELGNNSFDHNLGNWPDIPGIFFGYSTQKRYIVLADRGQGILTTLQRVRPSLRRHTDALRVAFTEVLTGRSPEHRGNGLKYVRKIVTQNDFSLQFQTGDAFLALQKGEKDLTIKTVRPSIIGCLIIFSF